MNFEDVFGFRQSGSSTAKPIELHMVGIVLRELAQAWGVVNDQAQVLFEKYTGPGKDSVSITEAQKDQALMLSLDHGRVVAKEDFARAIKLAKDAGYQFDTEDIGVWYKGLGAKPAQRSGK